MGVISIVFMGFINQRSHHYGTIHLASLGALPPYWKSTPAPNLQQDRSETPDVGNFSAKQKDLQFPMVFPWFSHGFPMIVGFPEVFPWDFQRFSLIPWFCQRKGSLSLDFQSFFLSGTFVGEPPKVLNPMPQTSPNQGVFLLPPISAKCGPQTIAKLVNITPNFTMFYDTYMSIYIYIYIYMVIYIYIQSIHGVYKPTNITFGDPHCRCFSRLYPPSFQDFPMLLLVPCQESTQKGANGDAYVSEDFLATW